MAEIGEVGSLGRILEEDGDIRDLGRSQRQLTQWPCKANEGIPSCPAIGCNLRLIHLVLKWWTAHQPKPKTIPVPVIREEVGVFASRKSQKTQSKHNDEIQIS